MPLSGVPVELEHPVASNEVQAAENVQMMRLHEEQVVLSKRVRKTRVSVTRTTSSRNEAAETDLNHAHVVIERVAIGRLVDAIPEIREEGDLIILPVVEEELVVIRRLVLKEEVHIRRVRTTQRHTETVALRQQSVTVTRTDIED